MFLKGKLTWFGAAIVLMSTLFEEIPKVVTGTADWAKIGTAVGAVVIAIGIRRRLPS